MPRNQLIADRPKRWQPVAARTRPPRRGELPAANVQVDARRLRRKKGAQQWNTAPTAFLHQTFLEFLGRWPRNGVAHGVSGAGAHAADQRERMSCGRASRRFEACRAHEHAGIVSENPFTSPVDVRFMRNTS